MNIWVVALVGPLFDPDVGNRTTTAKNLSSGLFYILFAHKKIVIKTNRTAERSEDRKEIGKSLGRLLRLTNPNQELTIQLLRHLAKKCNI